MSTIQILVGGKALKNLGSSRSTNDTDFLIFDTSKSEMFLHDVENNIDYLNANGSNFFASIYENEKGNVQASP